MWAAQLSSLLTAAALLQLLRRPPGRALVLLLHVQLPPAALPQHRAPHRLLHQQLEQPCKLRCLMRLEVNSWMHRSPTEWFLTE